MESITFSNITSEQRSQAYQILAQALGGEVGENISFIAVPGETISALLAASQNPDEVLDIWYGYLGQVMSRMIGANTAGHVARVI